MTMDIGRNLAAGTWGKTGASKKAAQSSPPQTSPVDSNTSASDHFSSKSPPGALDGIFESEPIIPNYLENPNERDTAKSAAAEVAFFFHINKKYTDENGGVSRSTLEEMASGTGRFENAPPAIQHKIRGLQAQTQYLIDNPGLFDELDKLDSDGRLYAENKNGSFDPENVQNLFYPPVLM